MNIPILKMNNISKTFPGVKALSDVTIELYKGEVHSIIGENGAGKSTLMKILCGVHQPDIDNSEVVLNGKNIKNETPHSAIDRGISMIHQELNLIPEMTISENIFLGAEISSNNKVTINSVEMHTKSKELLEVVGLNKSPNTKIKNLSVGEQQMVEIAKAISKNAQILIFDEPTAALTDSEIEKLFDLINELKKQKVAMVYISHRMDEIFKISNRITVLRDGKLIDTTLANETNIDEVISKMVGRELSDYYPERHRTESNEVALKVSNLTVPGEIRDISFELKKGEILGIAGLMGAGRTELTKALFGAKHISEGEIFLEGEKIVNKSPTEAIDKGIHLLTEDRKNEGLLLDETVQSNIILPNLRILLKRYMVDKKKSKKETFRMIKNLNIKTPTERQIVNNLSGGNQQKIVFGKWLLNEPKILILDEPTRGVDVGAKSEIYNIINELAKKGISIIMVSSELPELLGVTERILVMHEGKITGRYITENTNQEEIMVSATGGKNEKN